MGRLPKYLVINCLSSSTLKSPTKINVGKLGSTQGWRIEKPEKEYY